MREQIKQVRTYQTRLDLSPEAQALLSAYAALYGRVERTLFAALCSGETPGKLKSDYLKRFGITARQFNAVAILLKGKVQSIQERHTGLIQEAKARLVKAGKVIARLERKVPGSNTLHQKRRRLATRQARLARMEADQQAGRIRLCFGSRKLFRAQYALSANDFDSHAAWREAWQQARASEFFVIGSKGETAGCQGCVAQLQADGSVTLRLRLPDAIACRTGNKFLHLEQVRFAYGQDTLLDALACHRAISYRFKRDAKGWRLFASTEAIAVAATTHRQLGAIGVDLNTDHLALAELDLV